MDVEIELSFEAIKTRLIILLCYIIFDNMGKYLAGFEPSPHLDVLDQLFNGILKEIKNFPLNFPGTAYRHALQACLHPTIIMDFDFVSAILILFFLIKIQKL